MITCHYCRQPIHLRPDAYHVIGIDLSRTPPVSLYACRACLADGRPDLLTLLPVADNAPIESPQRKKVPQMTQLSLLELGL